MRIPHTSIIIATDTPDDKPLIPAIERAIEASAISKLNTSRALQVNAEYGPAGRVQAETLMADPTFPDTRFRTIASNRIADTQPNTQMIYWDYEPDKHKGSRFDSAVRPFTPAEIELATRSIARLRIEAHRANIGHPRIGAWNLPGRPTDKTDWNAVRTFHETTKLDFAFVHGYDAMPSNIRERIGLFRHYTPIPLCLAITPKWGPRNMRNEKDGHRMGRLARQQHRRIESTMIYINASWLTEGISAGSIIDWLDGYAKGITRRWWKK